MILRREVALRANLEFLINQLVGRVTLLTVGSEAKTPVYPRDSCSLR